MGVGPPGRTGREQLTVARLFGEEATPRRDEVVLLGCRHGLGSHSALGAVDGVLPYDTGCSGSVHTSVLEQMLRSGAGGVYLLTCPGRDCLYREGPKWSRQRIYEDREAELQPRVDRRRVRIGGFARSEVAAAKGDLEQFVATVRGLESESTGVTSAPQFECAPSLEEATADG